MRCTLVRLAAAAVIGTTLAGCSDGGSVTSVTIDGGDRTMVVGDALALDVTVATIGGASGEVAWESDAIGVASVDQGGLVTGLAPGSAGISAISAVDPAKNDTVTVTVEAAAEALGGLRVTVLGLPDGVPAGVTVVPAEGPSIEVQETTLLGRLEPGPYLVAAEDVCRLAGVICAATDRYVPEDVPISIDVLSGATLDVVVRYGCALLEPADPDLGVALLEAVHLQTGDPDAVLSCRLVGELETLDARQGSIEDLEGLQHARRLETLLLTRNEIVGLSPIAALTELRVLALGGDYVFGTLELVDLGPVAQLHALESLTVRWAKVSVLPDLAGLVALRHLVLDQTEVVDLGPIAALDALESLSHGDCYPPYPRSSLADLSPLSELGQLHSLVLSCHSIEDLSPLAGLTSLRTLDLGYNLIADVTPVAGLGIEEFSLRSNLLSSAQGFRSLPSLRRVVLDRNDIVDLRPLHLHDVEFESLEYIALSETCVRFESVPSAWYRADLFSPGRGVTVPVSLAAHCLNSTAPAPAVATFELSDEGWTVSGDGGAVRRVLSGGPGGGAYLEVDDLGGNVTWRWEAPPKFHGDASAFLGGELRVWLKQSSTTDQFVQDDVVLQGDGVDLRYRHDAVVGTDWTEVVIPLSTAGPGSWTVGGVAAVESDLATALTNVERLLIRGEFRTGSDTGGLGGVSMTVAAP